MSEESVKESHFVLQHFRRACSHGATGDADVDAPMEAAVRLMTSAFSAYQTLDMLGELLEEQERMDEASFIDQRADLLTIVEAVALKIRKQKADGT